jgi:CHAD domain-containing protein
MKADPNNSAPQNDQAERLRQLGRRRLEKFASLFARALIDDDVKTIHDVRVASRRLQQILRALGGDNANKNAKKVRRFLRGIRQDLGGLRNFDVMAQMALDLSAGAVSEAARAAWAEMSGAIQQQRGAESSRVQDALTDSDLTAFIVRTKQVLSRAPAGGKIDTALKAAVGDRFATWSDALREVGEDLTPKGLHALRIAGKRLRYLLEVRAALSDPEAKVLANSLSDIQDKLGDWHDSHVLLQFAGDYLRQKDFLTAHPGESRALLLDMESERRRAQTKVQEALDTAEQLRASSLNPDVETTANE